MGAKMTKRTACQLEQRQKQKRPKNKQWHLAGNGLFGHPACLPVKYTLLPHPHPYISLSTLSLSNYQLFKLHNSGVYKLEINGVN